MASPAPVNVVACTAVSRSRVPAARVLAESYLEHHPDHRFVVLVVDSRTTQAGPTGYETVGWSWLGVDEDEYLRMATIYSAADLLAAVTPLLLRKVLTEASTAIYLDHQIQVLRPMPEIAELAGEHEIVLTPHTLAPPPRDGRQPDDAAILSMGVFNRGFLAVGPGAEPFLAQWAGELLFADHRWVDQVPGLYRHFVLRDPDFGAGFWNVLERAGGTPRFFQFRNYQPDTPWLLTSDIADRPRVLLSEHPDLRALADGYRDALITAGYTKPRDEVSYGFARTLDGTVLTSSLRNVFRAAWMNAERPPAELHPAEREEVPPHPFGVDGGIAFQRWLCLPSTPAEAGAGLNRWVMAVWAQRPDLRQAFPRPCGEDAPAFRVWCRTFGVREGMLTAGAVPVEPVSPAPAEDRLGVNLLGYLTGELGLGEMSRIVHDAIRQAGVPVVSVVEERSLRCRTDVDRPETVGQAQFPVSLVCVNADQTRTVRESHPEVFHDRYRIGVWAWELEEFPAWQHDGFESLDEVWTVSEFCRKAIATHSPVPVKVIPVPVRDPGSSTLRERAPGQPVQFLYLFDFNSTLERKNPLGLLRAFRLAFGERDDVRLVIKATNGERHPRAAERLRAAVAGDDRVTLLERYLTVAELDALYAESDCYVSLHRSEGFGLTVAEAMARGMPVISTDYSSTPEFLDATTGWPVSYHLTTVPPDCEPYHEGAVWAAPDEQAAANAMREVAFDPEEAARRGTAAREHILRTRSMAEAGRWMRSELERAYQSWQAGGHRQRPARTSQTARRGADDPLAAWHEAMAGLHSRPDVAAESRIPLAPVMRRAVLRAIDHYDAHQRQTLGALAGGIDDLLTQILGRLTALESAAAATPVPIPDPVSLSQHQALREQVDDVRRIVTKSETRLDDVEADTARLDDKLAASERLLPEAVDGLGARLDEQARVTSERLGERDRRIDSTDLEVHRVRREVEVLHQIAALRHVPVPAGAEVVICDAGTLLVPHDKIILPALRAERCWEPVEAALLAELAGAGTVLDVGAHVGYHTLRLLLQCPGVERVIAVEAHPVNADLLRRNVIVNLPAKGADKVLVLPVAAWDRAATLRLFHGEAGNSGDYRVRADADPAGMIEVPAIRLDEHPEVRAGRVTLIKTDLQGRDHRAIAGLHGVLTAHRPHVVCEFWPAAITELGDDPIAVLGGYRSLGYRPVPVGADGRPARLTDAELVDKAGTAEGGFLSLWLQP